jgi:hypothetical protein
MAPEFTTYGKAWQTLGQLKAHLSLMKSYAQYSRIFKYPYNNCVVIKFIEDGTIIDSIDLKKLYRGGKCG